MILADPRVAATVARHRSFFFVEKDAHGQVIDYATAAAGHLRVVPEGETRTVLERDYVAVATDNVMVGEVLRFKEPMQPCAPETEVNSAAVR